MSVYLIILTLLILADFLIMLAAGRAPRGYEDEHGFHLLQRKK